MMGQRLRRVSAMVGAIAGATLMAGLIAGPASATTKSVSCSSLTGDLNSHTPPVFDLGGCTGNTGGGGVAQGNTITWTNGQSTSLLNRAFPFKPQAHAKRKNCAALSDRWAVADKVVGDSTGTIKVGGKVTGKVCVMNEGSDTWSLAPGSTFKLL
jgi:hypothetical protein